MTAHRHGTPTRDSEVRRSLAMQAAGIGDGAIDVDRRRIQLSREGASLLGLPPRETELPLDRFIDIVHPDDRGPLNAALDRIIAERAVVELRFRVVHPDNAVRWLLVRGQYHESEEGRRVLGVMVDIQREVELEELSATHKDVLVHQRDELERLNAQLQTITAHVVRAQEEERLRISRELHDEIGQVLTACVMNLELGAEEGADAAQLQQEVLRDLRHALRQLRQLSLELRPPLLDEGGLQAALRWLLERLLGARRIDYRMTVEGIHDRLSPALETTAYRIVQEALTNVVRHAEASHVAVELRAGQDEITIRVSDDGRGFDVAAVRRRCSRGGGSVGFLNLTERAMLLGGQCEIVSTPGAGCVVLAWLPLPQLPGVEDGAASH